ncbi:MAG: hypothetical protein ACREBC_16155 [Pyrinomonadaceae bacterium]
MSGIRPLWWVATVLGACALVFFGFLWIVGLQATVPDRIGEVFDSWTEDFKLKNGEGAITLFGDYALMLSSASAGSADNLRVIFYPFPEDESSLKSLSIVGGYGVETIDRGSRKEIEVG